MVGKPYNKVFIAAAAFMALAVGIAAGATVTQAITYQGRLADAAGNPLTGTYSVTFRLYDVSSGGTALYTDTHGVTAANGLFTTQIAFDSTLFDGRALWLGIKAGSDPEMAPRQEIRPVPYALGLRPGAVITGTAVTNPSLKVINTGNNAAALIAGTTGTNSPALFANAQGTGSPAVYAQSPNDISVYGIGKTGGYFTTNQGGAANAERPAVNVTTAFDFNPGMEITTRGVYSNGITILNTGFQSDAVYIRSESEEGAGVNVHMRKADSVGIHSVTYDDDSVGVFGMSEGADCSGVEAYSTGARSEAVSGFATGADGIGIYGESKYSTGVSGKGKEGGYFTTRQAGDGVNVYPGVNVSTAFSYNPGIRVRTTGSASPGISATTGSTSSDGASVATYGYDSDGIESRTSGAYSYAVYAVAAGDGSHGVYSSATGAGSRGVYAFSAKDYGVYGESVGMAGVRGQSSTAGGVYGRSQNEYGVYGVTDRADNKYGVYTPDRISALAYDTNAGDVAEYMPVNGDAPPGTVLVIGKGGVLGPSSAAYDTRVAGIVSTAPGVSLGTKEEGNAGEALIAVAGRVPCRVDASYGAITEGDLLTTSATPGHAMKAEPIEAGGRTFYPGGIVLGKAMGSLEAGTGVIDVLVTLQ